MLDLIGDLSLLGHPVIGHVLADRAGHAMHAALATRILADKTAWKLVTGSAEAQRPQIDMQPVGVVA
jgi:UDP-3-O-[3-hydroxymyristoyl] N-acetylglucosamine deacetylase